MRNLDRNTLTRLAIGGALLAALTLAGCGRKGPLDSPSADAGHFPTTLAAKTAPVALVAPRA